MSFVKGIQVILLDSLGNSLDLLHVTLPHSLMELGKVLHFGHCVANFTTFKNIRNRKDKIMNVLLDIELCNITVI